MTHTAELPRRAWHSAFVFIVCLSAVVALVAGCETSSTTSSGPDPLKCQVSVTAPPMIEAGGGTGTLAVTTNRECAWTATSSAPWIDLSPSSGQGSANVELRATPNDGNAQRDGDIVVNDQQIRVSQRAPCRFEITPGNSQHGCGRWQWPRRGFNAERLRVDGHQRRDVDIPGHAGLWKWQRRGHLHRCGQWWQPAYGQRCHRRSAVNRHTGRPCRSAGAADAAAAGVTVTAPVAILQLHHFTDRSERRRCRRCRLGRRLHTGRLRLGCSERCIVDRRDVGSERDWKRLGGVLGRRQHQCGAHRQPDDCGSGVHCHAGGLRVHPVEGRGEHTLERGLCVGRRLDDSGCAWTSSSNSSWLSIQSGSGTGSGQVSYSIGENPGGPRIGSLIVAGQTFVRRAGGSSRFSGERSS